MDSQILTEDLPSRMDIPYALGTIKRWKDIASQYSSPIRIIATSNNPKVEKYFTKICADFDDIYLTVIPEGVELIDRLN